ncbi:lithocholate 6-beta-hydroxylase [Caerostris extrusa]|uniref:Lithocholate 6-beta-hydroxylase n=1 Tax=Caerostris extrusa TaxID=172846 RepID=A0AAV4XW20_CAEEX|nr:lithocholate 6-beta-hydroxylase [Caerostris extrusa]
MRRLSLISSLEVRESAKEISHNQKGRSGCSPQPQNDLAESSILITFEKITEARVREFVFDDVKIEAIRGDSFVFSSFSTFIRLLYRRSLVISADLQTIPEISTRADLLKRMLEVELFFGPLGITLLVGVSTVVLLLLPLFQIEIERYRKLGPVYGYYETSKPIISIGDPTLLKDIMVKDFPFFTGRRRLKTDDPVIDKMLSIIRGEDWKRIRSIVTPTFTTGKLKRMLAIFKECSETLTKNFKAAAEEGKPVDVKRVYGAFTMDVIASAAFSTKIDSHNDPDNEFVSTARTVFGGRRGISFIFFLVFPRLVKLIRLGSMTSKATDFFKHITLQIIEERKQTGQAELKPLKTVVDRMSVRVSPNAGWICVASV